MIALFKSVNIDVQRSGGQGVSKPGRNCADIHTGGNQKRGCGMSEAMEGNDRQLILWRLIGVITVKHILEDMIWGRVVHHLAVVLHEDPIAALPKVSNAGCKLLP